MHYLLTHEELYIHCSENLNETGKSNLNLKKICKEREAYYLKIIDKLEKDKRLEQIQEGFILDKIEDKESVENEYGFMMIPIHPDDYIFE